MSAYTCSNVVHHHEVEAVLAPGEALQRCSGQDILKRGAPSGKGKHRLLIVLPVQLALPALSADCRLGHLLHLQSPAPEYHLQIEQGTLVFVGEYLHPTNRFLSIHCPPISGRVDDRGNGQCSMTDVFDRLLVFDMPTFVPSRALIGSSGRSDRWTAVPSSNGPGPALVTAPPHTVATRFGVSSLTNHIAKSTKSASCKKASRTTGKQGRMIPTTGSVSDDDDDGDDDDSDGDEDDTVSNCDEVISPSGSRVVTRRPSAATQRISYKDDSSSNSSSSEGEKDSDQASTGPSKSKLTKAPAAAKKIPTTSTVPPPRSSSRADRKPIPLRKRARGRDDGDSDEVVVDGSKVTRHSLTRPAAAAEAVVIVLDD